MKRDRKLTSRRNSQSSATGTIRIIAGQFRGRKLPVLDAEGLRPTTDRTKETVFNWLMHDVLNTNCLDLFAGSGGLGFEALSRYARKVTFVEKDILSAKQLQTNFTQLNTDRDQFILSIGDAFEFLAKTNDKYGLIFIDPPFGKSWVEPAVEAIIKRELLVDGGLIYVEQESATAFAGTDFGLTLKKLKTTRQVSCSLWRK
jgi:16S rRNA (guanine966-N2)-methyltransferase